MNTGMAGVRKIRNKYSLYILKLNLYVLAAAIAALVVTIIMNVFGVSNTDQLGHEKLRKVFYVVWS